MRAVITGLGAITSLGENYQTLWKNICEGKHGISKIFHFNTSHYKTSFAAVITNFNPLEHFTDKQVRNFDRAHQLAIVAARNAIMDSKLNKVNFNRYRAGLFIGSSLSGNLAGQSLHRCHLIGKKMQLADLYSYPMHACLDRISADIGFYGPRSLPATACTASTIAIAHASLAIQLGQADIILAGGVDPLSEFSFAGFSSMNNMATKLSAPFSLPTGLMLGEAAGLLIIESLEHAQSRGAKVYAEIIGSALKADAYHATSPDSSGQSQKQLIIKAMENSCVNLDEVDYINVHGTGTLGNDRVEAKGIRLAFGDRYKEVFVSSTKGAIGHTLGAAGGIEALLTTLAVYHNKVPPTANFTQLRPGCELNHVIAKGLAKKIKVAVTQNFAFGGNNVALVICKPKIKKKINISSSRVVITGLGLVTPFGIGIEVFLKKLKAASSGITPMNRWNNEKMPQFLGGILPTFNAQDYSRVDIRRLDRLGIITVIAAELAIKSSKLKISRQGMDDVGIALGTNLSHIESLRLFNEPIALGNPNKLNPIHFPNTVTNACTGQAAIHLNLKGPNIVLSMGQASGLRAIAYAYDLIRTGAVPSMLAGGAEEIIPLAIEGFYRARVLAPIKNQFNKSCPFDQRRNGLILGEGAALITLESLDVALKRGAPILGEILGHHCNADKAIQYSRDPSGTGIEHCMRGALKNSDLNSSDIDIISAGAMSHPIHDRTELRAIQTIFAKNDIGITAFSSVVGVSSATAPMALAAHLLGMAEDFVPPHLNYFKPDPTCGCTLIEAKSMQRKSQTVLLNSISLGGTNTSMIINKYRE